MIIFCIVQPKMVQLKVNYVMNKVVKKKFVKEIQQKPFLFVEVITKYIKM